MTGGGDIAWLRDRLAAAGDAPAVLSGAPPVTYRDLLATLDATQDNLNRLGVAPGEVVLLDASATAPSLALLLAVLERGGIAVPFSSSSVTTRDTAAAITRATWSFRPDPATGVMTGERLAAAAPSPPPRIARLADDGIGGLVIFTSGSTGQPKASLHRADRFLAKFQTPRPPLRTVLVLPLDHMAGLDSLLYTLASGGAAVVPTSGDADAICDAIATHQAELLPATPSLLNVLLLSGGLERHDLSSLRLITYGAEVMPPSTLARLREALPGCRLLQKYGATEFGSPSTRSREDGSLWFRVTDPAFETRIVDGILWVRSGSSMVGYLNAEDPFEADGWINTGDRVETDGEFLRILGRASDMINVGGHKVHPAEVENVLLDLDNVEDATVRGEPNPLLGTTVTAVLKLREPEPLAAVRSRIRTHCRDRLPREAIPVRIELAETELWTPRFKKSRTSPSAEPPKDA